MVNLYIQWRNQT